MMCKTVLLAALLVGGLAFSAPADAQWTELQKLTVGDGASGDGFGNGVTMYGDHLLVGAYQDDNLNGTNAGAVYSFVPTANGWVEQQKILPNGGGSFDVFGHHTIALDGAGAVISAYRHDLQGKSDAGAAWFFAYDGTEWVEQQKLVAPDAEAGDWFGRVPALDGNTLIVGAPRDDHSGLIDAGSAYVFEWDGTAWVFVEKLIPSDLNSNDRFGHRVAISGDLALLSAHNKDPDGSTDAGAVYVYRRILGQWTEEGVLLASDAESYDCFGYSVAISDDTIVVGAPEPDHGRAGSAYVFHRVDEAWTQIAKLGPGSDGVVHGGFGADVALSGGYVLVGAFAENATFFASGAVHVFCQVDGVWVQCQKLAPSDTGTYASFGHALSAFGNRAIIGAYTAHGGTGSAYLFESNQPPTITCGGPVALWSPDHELVDVSSAITVEDPDGDDLTLSFRVFSDESEVPETGDGTGRHAPDFKDEYPDGRGLLVRAERRGPEDGRFYILLVTADDGNGGAATAVCQAAVVPHDQDQQSLDDVLAQAEAAAFDVQTAVDSGAALPPPGLYEHGLSDPLGPKQ